MNQIFEDLTVQVISGKGKTPKGLIVRKGFELGRTWERQQMLKEVLEVVENIAMYEPTFDPTRSMRYSQNGTWICPINLKDELTKKFSASDET